MSTKQKALARVAELGCEVRVNPGYPMTNPKQIEAVKEFGCFDGKVPTEYEVIPPHDKVFEEGLTSLICVSWQDVIDRLSVIPLIDYVEDMA